MRVRALQKRKVANRTSAQSCSHSTHYAYEPIGKPPCCQEEMARRLSQSDAHTHTLLKVGSHSFTMLFHVLT